jgi:hypothetical protein
MDIGLYLAENAEIESVVTADGSGEGSDVAVQATESLEMDHES